MIKGISGQIKAKAALMDPNHYGRSDTSPIGRWFWEIDKVLLLLVTVLIAIGLIAVAAASPAAGDAAATAIRPMAISTVISSSRTLSISQTQRPIALVSDRP